MGKFPKYKFKLDPHIAIASDVIRPNKNLSDAYRDSRELMSEANKSGRLDTGSYWQGVSHAIHAMQMKERAER